MLSIQKMAVACRDGTVDEVKLLIRQGTNNEWLNINVNRSYMQEYGCEHKNLYDCTVYDWGLYEACKTANMGIIELMIEMGATLWNVGLEGACFGNHQSVIDLMLVKANITGTAINWNNVLSGSYRGRHSHLVEWGFSKGAKNHTNNLHDVCAGGDLKILQLMLKDYHVFYCYDLLVKTACYYNQSDVVEFLISKVPTKYSYTWVSFLKISCKNKCFDIVKIITNYMIGHHDLCLMIFVFYKTNVICDACEGGSLEIVHFLLDIVTKFGNLNHILWNTVLKSACIGGNMDLVRMAINHGAINYNKGLEGAFYARDVNLVNYMIKKGANVGTSTLMACLDCMVFFVMDYTDVIKILIKKEPRLQNYDILHNTTDLWIYNVRCIGSGIDRRSDKRYLLLLLKSPAYIILVGNIVARARSRHRGGGCGDSRFSDKHNVLQRLPNELIRLLFEY